MNLEEAANIVRPAPDLDKSFAALQAATDTACALIDKLRAENKAMKAALEQCEEYFDNRADADGDSEGFHPNKEMNLLTEVREALYGRSY